MSTPSEGTSRADGQPAAHRARGLVQLPAEPLSAVTHRQVQLLILAANGHTNRAIAKKRGISEDTVKSQMQVIYRKLRVSDRAQAVAVALVIGLLTTSDVQVPEGVLRPGPRRVVRRVTPKPGL